MNIILKQSDIEKAVRQYLGTQVNLRGKDVAMIFTNGRKDNGISVELEITDRPVSHADCEDNFADFLESVGAALGGVLMVRATRQDSEPAAEAQGDAAEAPEAVVEDAAAPATAVTEEVQAEAEAPVEVEAAEAPAKAPVASLFGG